MGFLSPEDHPALICTGAPFLLGVSYVASLYVSWTEILFASCRLRQELKKLQCWFSWKLQLSFSQAIPQALSHSLSSSLIARVDILYFRDGPSSIYLYINVSGVEIPVGQRSPGHHQEEVCLRGLHDHRVSGNTGFWSRDLNTEFSLAQVFVWKFGAGHLLEKYTLMDLIGLRTPGILQ